MSVKCNQESAIFVKCKLDLSFFIPEVVSKTGHMVLHFILVVTTPIQTSQIIFLVQIDTCSCQKILYFVIQKHCIEYVVTTLRPPGLELDFSLII
jgi:hypothetical protein